MQGVTPNWNDRSLVEAIFRTRKFGAGIKESEFDTASAKTKAFP